MHEGVQVLREGAGGGRKGGRGGGGGGALSLTQGKLY